MKKKSQTTNPIKTDIKTGETKTKKALKEEIFKAHIQTSTIQIIKQEVTNEIGLIKKLCMRELKQNHTEQEVNINLKIFDLFEYWSFCFNLRRSF